MTSPEEVRQALLKKFPELIDNIEILEDPIYNTKDETNTSNYKIKINCLYRELFYQAKLFIVNEKKWISISANDKVLSDTEYNWKLFERMNKIILSKTD